MIGSKYFKILASFSREELKSFEIWLNSPWCNTNKSLISLLKVVKKYHPNFVNLKIKKEKLFYRILPNGKFSDRRMNNILSEGYLAAEKFMVFEHLKNQKPLVKKILIQEHYNRNLDEWYSNSSDKEIKRIEDKPIKDWEDHLALLQYHRQAYRQPANTFRIISGGKAIIRMSEELDMFYAQELAAIINEKIFRSRILPNEYHDVSEELILWIKLTNKMSHPSIDLYKIRFDYEEINLLEKFEKYKFGVENSYYKMNMIDQKMHFYSLTNDLSFLIKKQLLQMKDLLPVYKFGLKSGIIIENGMILTKSFTILVFGSNFIKDFDWTKSFIDKYWKRVSSGNEVSHRDWALAHTAYYSGDIKRALNILLNGEFKTQYFLRLTKLLTMQCYFDLFLKDRSYQIYLFNYFDSYEKYMSRSTDQSKSNNQSWIRLIQVSRAIAKNFLEDVFQKEKVENLPVSYTHLTLPTTPYV